MPKIHVQQTINSYMIMELWETALEPENRLINMKNCGETLKFKETNTKKKPPNRLKKLLNKNRLQLEELRTREHVDKSNASISNTKISIEDINDDEFELVRYNPSTLSHSAGSKNFRPAFPQMSKIFNLKIMKLFLQHLGRPPSSAQLCILNNLCTSLSTIDDFTTSPLAPFAQPWGNERSSPTTNLIHKSLSNSVLFANLPAPLIEDLVNSAGSFSFSTFHLSGLNSTTAFHSIASGTQDPIDHSNSEWANSTLTDIDITRSKFIDTNLQGITFNKVDSAYVNYTGATLSGATFKDVNFNGSNFHNADLSDISFDRVDFSNTNLTGTNISLSTTFLRNLFSTSDSIDHHLNHLHNGDQGLLVSINSISSAFEVKRTQLMASVIERLEELSDLDLEKSWASLANILLKEPSYSKDNAISRFIQSRLLPKWMDSRNQ